MKKITLLLIDDHKLLVNAWAAVLNSDERFLVIGQTGNAEEAYQIVKNRHPRVVLTDINMSPVDGFTITKRICNMTNKTKVIGVTLHNIPAFARKMLQAGALGYVTKNSSIEELKMAILEVSIGRKYVCEEIKEKQVQEQFEDDPKEGVKRLTRRELDMIEWIRKGLSSKEIGLQLDISVKTVEVHRYNILRKLKVRNTAALVTYVNSVGL